MRASVQRKGESQEHSHLHHLELQFWLMKLTTDESLDACDRILVITPGDRGCSLSEKALLALDGHHIRLRWREFWQSAFDLQVTHVEPFAVLVEQYLQVSRQSGESQPMDNAYLDAATLRLRQHGIQASEIYLLHAKT